MEKQIIIYGLCHPISGELRYVGMTRYNLSKRLDEHLKKRFSKNPTYCQSWIKSLKSQNFKPEIFELDTVLYNEWEFWEQWWIQYMKSLGCNLTNLTNGGDHGLKVTSEIRYKISESMKKHSSIIGERSKKALLGKSRSKEIKEKQSATMKKMYKDGIIHSPFQDKEKLVSILKKSSQINKGNTYRLGKSHSKETKKKMSLSIKKSYQNGRVIWNKGILMPKPVSLETRKKLSESIKFWWNKRKEVN